MSTFLLSKEGSCAINQFLRSSRQAALKPSPSTAKLSVFLGNQACDLDSIVSSISLALHAHLTSSSPHPSVAILNIPRADLPLRPESVHLFQLLDIESQSLTFIDEVDLPSLQADGRLQLTLVDHNKLSPTQRVLAPSVSAIVDHHADAGQHLDATPRRVTTAGSCATLAFETARPIAAANPALAALLLAAILLDTRNLQARTTPADLAAARLLAASARLPPKVAPAELYALLQARKLQQAHLSTAQLLRKDFKRYHMSGRAVGISSVGLPLAVWAARLPSDVLGLTPRHLRTYAAAKRLDLLLVMAAFEDRGVFRRQLALCDAEAKTGLAEGLAGFLGRRELGLELEPMGPLKNCCPQDVLAFHLRNAQMSRKRLSPLLEAYFGDSER